MEFDNQEKVDTEGSRPTIPALRRENQILQSLIASAEIAALVVGPDGRVRHLTAPAAQLLKLNETDIGIHLHEISALDGQVAGSDLETEVESLLSARRQHPRVLETADGRSFRMHIRPLDLSDHDDAGIAIIFVEAGHADSAERHPHDAEEWYRILAENVKEYAFITLDTEGRITTWNIGAQRIMGYREHEALGQPVDIIFTEEDRAHGRSAREMEIAARTGQASDERWHRRQDGSLFWSSGVMTSLRDSTGTLQGFAKVMRDNTERKRTTDALIKSEAHLRLARDAAKLGTWEIVEGESDFRMSGEMALICGLDPATETMALADFYNVIHPEDRDRVAALERQAWEETGEFDGEYRVRSAGQERWVNGRGRLLDDGLRRRIIGVIYDVTVTRQAAELLRRLNQALEERVEERNLEIRELIALLAVAEGTERRRIAKVLHDDLQQILYGIQMKLHLTHEDVKANALGSALDSLTEMEVWIRDAISTLRKLSADLSSLLQLETTFTDSLARLGTQMKQVHGLTVDVRATRDDIDGLHEDVRILLFQVIRELLFNIVKHAETDHAQVNVERNDGDLLIQVRDWGRGFDPDALNLDDRAKWGHGLRGMSERLQLINATLQIRAAPNDGTCVMIRLPFEE